MKRIIAVLLCLCTVLCLFTGCGKEPEISPTPAPTETEKPPQPVYELTDAEVTKEETVFVNLAPDGTLRKVSVTDKLHTEKPQVRIEDASPLRDITDVKTFTEPVYEDGKLCWDMQSTDLYYSGTTDKAPPLDISVSYTLDGRPIAYTELAGRSGSVTMDISVKSSLKKTVSVGGREYDIECPMLLLCGMLLPEDGFSDVTADNGVILSDGSHKLVFFMGVPGMGKSLGLDAIDGLGFIGETLGSGEYSVSAETESFSLGNLMLVAVPFSSVRSLGFKNISVGVDGLKDMLIDVEELMGAFGSLDLTELISLLYGDAAQLQSLINAVGDAVQLYERNKVLIEVLNKYVTEENLEKLERVMEDMEELDTGRIKALAAAFEPFARLAELVGRIDKNIGGLTRLTGDCLDLLPMLESLSEELESAEVKGAVDELPQTLEKLRALTELLRGSEELLDRTVRLFSSDAIERIREFTGLLTGSESLGTLTEAQAEGLAGRMRAWLDFGEEYDIFTERTEKQSSSVVFVYKTDAIG